MARASEAQLPGTFVAWLSLGATDARDRLAGARGFERIDGLAIADQPGEVVTAL
ncbi:MAG: hypothetical protein H0T79_18000, partial [Deltaproteobacteria bacterium]|nr:hypothetical protein [Deltaproteobacteria bacterium]